MNIFTNYSKAVWLPLILIVAWTSLIASNASAQQIQWHQDLAEAKAEARDTNRLVWLHFSADWCVPCKRLDSFVFSNTSVVRAADRNTVAVKIDVDAHESLVKQLNVPRIPYDVVMTPSGRVILDRASARDSAGFRKMFDSLDRPLQELTKGDREVINSRIDKINGIIKQTGGLRQKQSDLDLDGPAHEMASTTVEGQRLERGFESSQRAAEVRAIKANLLKKKAEVFIAEQKNKTNVPQQPKISENPFFKTPDSPAQSTSLNNQALAGKQSQASTSGPKVVSNVFVKQAQLVKDKTAFIPPLPPSFGQPTAEKVVVDADQNLQMFEERTEFSFAEAAPKKTVAKAEKVKAAQAGVLAAPKVSQPELASRRQALPQLPGFKDRTVKKTDSNNFAYAPVDRLAEALDSKTKPSLPVKKTALKSFDNPINNSIVKATPKLGLSGPQRPATPRRPTRVQQRTTIDTFAQIERPTMKTAISIPQAPVMVEGVVQIAETVVPAIEGRLVAAEQSIDRSSMVRSQEPRDTIQKQLSRTDRLLENVNFFGPDPKLVQAAPQTFAVPSQPVPQSQIVINMNPGVAPQVTQSGNQAVIIQPNMVARASTTGAVTNRAKISSADIASAVRSKYALKGKCPVTLLSLGQWVDGKKEIGCVHRDRVYLFATAAHREAFLANPDQLSPLLAGFDPVIFEETGKLIEGDEKFGTFMGKKPNQRIVLFKTADTRERFQKEPSHYLNIVRAAMTKNAPKDIKLR